MQLKRLALTNFRAFERAEFEFQPGMNLLVGVNGVGKSTVIDALRVLLSQVLPKVTPSKSPALSFVEGDITVGRDALTTQMEFVLDIEQPTLFSVRDTNPRFTYLVHKPRYRYIQNPDAIGQVREQAIEQIERRELSPSDVSLFGDIKSNYRQPIAIYFSTRRSLQNMRMASKSRTVGGQAAAYAEALSQDREMNLGEFAAWLLAQNALAKEEYSKRTQLQHLARAVSEFLDGFSNLRATRELKKRATEGKGSQDRFETKLLVDKNNMTLDLRQLSDGERGILALVLDMARRLVLANPRLRDPLREGNAVVLIDELDLHLHPTWQRDIVRKLTETFPNCQFIATTHSPQIVGEVQPENIIMLESGVPPYRPDQSLGMDTNWILKRIMDTPERNVETDKALARIARLIENEKYEQATKALEKLRANLGEFPELVRLQTRLDRITLLGK